MKIGFNLLLWTAHAGPEHHGLLREIKRAGYDGVEVPVFEGSVAGYQALGGMLRKDADHAINRLRLRKL